MGALSESSLAALINQTAQLIYIIDLNGRIIYANPQVEKVLGYPLEETIGREAALLTSGIQGFENPQEFWRTIATRGTWKGVIFNKSKIGQPVLQAAEIFTLKEADGEVIGCAVIQYDVAGQAHIAEQLAKQLQESRALFQISQMLAGALDLSATLQQIADAASALIKSSSRTILHLLEESGTFLRAVAVSGSDRPMADHRMNFKLGEGIAGIALYSGQTISVPDVMNDPRYILVKNTSEPLLRSLLVAPVKTGDKILGTLSVQSLTPGAFSADDERLLATLGTQAAVAIEKAQLLRSEREQRQEVDFLYKVSQKLSGYLDSGKMIEQFLDLLCETFDYYRIRVFLIDDESGSLMLTNARGEEESTGINSESGRLQEDSVLNQVVLSLQPMVIPAGEIPKIVQREAQASSAPARLVIPIKSGGPVLGVLDIHHRARREFSSREVQLMQTVSDQLAAAVEKAMLYAELQAALQQEKAARTQLVQAEKLAALGRIVASVAHELNNPLQAIQNALYLIKLEESLPSQAREDLQTVLNEADRMAGLISRLREAYRPAVKEEFQIESLNVLVTEVQRLLSTHLRHNQIEFEFQPDDRLPKIPMIRDQIKQVILNVSLNAVEAMSEGGYITVRTWHETKAKSVVLSIADTGPSIGADILPYIFDPFITTKEGGTGLGLAITYDIVRRHNGRIEVESELGKVTIFKVWLPLKQGFERESQARSITGIGKK